MAGSLKGKIVLITGTGSGMGRAGALRFAAAGATVVGADLNAEGNAETEALVTAAGGRMLGTAPVDLGDYAACKRWVDAAVRTHGRIDVLWNNASACVFATIEAMTVEQWDFSIRNELSIVFLVTKAAWPHLTASAGAGADARPVVINTASVAGHGGGPGGIAHSATKAAVLAMTHVIAAEGAPYGIRAVSISPGAMDTPGSAEQLALPGAREALLSHALVPRLGDPDEVARAAVFLASADASFITGADLLVDGGLTNHG
ncbi:MULTISPECIES: SDR family NAD(P)-dependent oxidoreductase [Frankia]|uniref:Short chain dehydrogenase putative signal peptide n=1 Tax=Frankia alni (strain DSM 45986 / CECT 9034 / ACN14a) TaxID=326424 RepID=Q0RIH0_FRAAA|nr:MULTISPECIES: SDR family oxidoreductase [Frankia]CAJ62699.1 putative short chain dehydrogenase; putative signal peptide [Frankia alni ACN14a]